MKPLTKKQKNVLDYIREFISRRGYSPSVEEVADGVGLKSKATVHAHLHNLAEKGIIKIYPNRARSIEVVAAYEPPSTENVVEIPLLGYVAAGKPIEAIENPEMLAAPSIMLGKTESFALRVKGDSMTDDHILDGDYVIVEKRETAENGEVVVALIDGSEATIKRFYSENGKVRLEPRNPNMAPMFFEPERVAIQGAVTAVMRRF